MNKILQAIISIFKKSYDSLPEQVSAKTPIAPSPTKPNINNETQIKAPVVEEPKVKELVETEAKAEPVIEAVVKAPTIQASKITSDNLPQDSIQRRHALSQLHNIIETIKGPRPSDSIQNRHYDALIKSIITQALTDKSALENLYKNYGSIPKTILQVIIKPTTQVQETIVQAEESPVTEVTSVNTQTEPVISIPPTDSILRRHYDSLINNQGQTGEAPVAQESLVQETITHTEIEPILSAVPTDSILRRHYDTLINNELNRLLEEQ